MQNLEKCIQLTQNLWTKILKDSKGLNAEQILALGAAASSNNLEETKKITSGMETEHTLEKWQLAQAIGQLTFEEYSEYSPKAIEIELLARQELNLYYVQKVMDSDPLQLLSQVFGKQLSS